MRKKVVGLVILMMILFAHSVMAITNPNGTSGTCAWELNNSGDLVIRPTSGEEGTLASWWHAPWQDNCDQIKTVRFEGTVKAQTCVNMFNNCSNLTSIDFTGFDTSNATSMGSMFYNCISLTTLDVSGLDTSNVVGMGGMFYNCQSLTALDVSNFNTSKVTSMFGMFYNCSSLTQLDLSHFDVNKVTEFKRMFAGCQNITILDLHSFVPENIFSIDYMFEGCEKLEYIDISGFNTTSLEPNWYYDYQAGMFHTFYDLPSLHTLVIGNDFVLPDNELYDETDIFDDYPEEWKLEEVEEYYLPKEWLTGNMAGTYHRTGRNFDFVKIDEATQEPMAGVKFCLKNNWGEYLVSTEPREFGEEENALEFTTDENGKITIPNLCRGRYFLCEKETVEGYQDNPYSYLIEFTHDEMAVLKLESEDDFEIEEITSTDDDEIPTKEVDDEYRTNQYQVNYTETTLPTNIYVEAYWEDIEAGKAVIWHSITRNWTLDNSSMQMTLSPRFQITSITVPDSITYTTEDRKVTFDLTQLPDTEEAQIGIELELIRASNDGEWFRVYEKNPFVRDINQYNSWMEVEVSSPKLAELKAIYSGEELETDENGAFIITNTPVPKSSYTVKYIDKETGESISGDKVVGEVVVGTEITVADEVVEIEGYVYDSCENETIVISENEEDNIITLLYMAEEIEPEPDPVETPTPTPTRRRSGGSSKPRVVEEENEETPSGEELPTDTPSGEVLPSDTPSGETISGEVLPEDIPSGEVTPTPTPTPGKKYHYTLKQEDDGHHDWYVRGYEDYTFRINNSITREEIATIFYRLTVVPENDIRQSLEVNEDPFTDVDKDRWSARPIAYMKTLGVMQGYPDGSFDPTRPITRAEFAEVARKYAENTIEHKESTFQDVDEDYWASEAIRIAYEQGWIQGYDDGTFQPTKDISRVETVTIVNRMLHRKLNTFYLDKVKIPVVDLDPTHWGYADVIEAIIEYDYELNEDGGENLLRYRYPFHEDMSGVAYNDV